MLLEVITDAVEPAGITRADIDFTCRRQLRLHHGPGRSRSCRTSTPSAPGRPSATATSRWTARGRCTRRGSGCSRATSTIAVVTGSGRSSTGDPALIYPMEMDPYYLAPLGADPLTFAALQARALIDAGKVDRARRWPRWPRAAGATRSATRTRRSRATWTSTRCCARTTCARRCVATTCRPSPTARPRWSSPRGDRARELCEHPVWIRGFDHRTECHNPAFRDLADSPSTRIAAKAAGVGDGAGRGGRAAGRLHATRSSPARGARAVGDDVTVNPSGGPLAANPIMATGLVPHRLRRRAHLRRAATGALSPTRRPDRACSRTWSASSRGRADEPRSPVPSSASARRTTRRAGATCRSAASCARRRCRALDDAHMTWPTSTPSCSARRPTCSRAS